MKGFDLWKFKFMFIWCWLWCSITSDNTTALTHNLFASWFFFFVSETSHVKLTILSDADSVTVVCVVNWSSSSSSAPVQSLLWDTHLPIWRENSFFSGQRLWGVSLFVPEIFPTRWRWVHYTGQCHSASCWYLSAITIQLGLWFTC